MFGLGAGRCRSGPRRAPAGSPSPSVQQSVQCSRSQPGTVGKVMKRQGAGWLQGEYCRSYSRDALSGETAEAGWYRYLLQWIERLRQRRRRECLRTQPRGPLLARVDL